MSRLRFLGANVALSAAYAAYLLGSMSRSQSGLCSVTTEALIASGAAFTGLFLLLFFRAHRVAEESAMDELIDRRFPGESVDQPPLLEDDRFAVTVKRIFGRRLLRSFQQGFRTADFVQGQSLYGIAERLAVRRVNRLLLVTSALLLALTTLRIVARPLEGQTQLASVGLTVDFVLITCVPLLLSLRQVVSLERYQELRQAISQFNTSVGYAANPPNQLLMEYFRASDPNSSLGGWLKWWEQHAAPPVTIPIAETAERFLGRKFHSTRWLFAVPIIRAEIENGSITTLDQLWAWTLSRFPGSRPAWPNLYHALSDLLEQEQAAAKAELDEEFRLFAGIPLEEDEVEALFGEHPRANCLGWSLDQKLDYVWRACFQQFRERCTEVVCTRGRSPDSFGRKELHSGPEWLRARKRSFYSEEFRRVFRELLDRIAGEDGFVCNLTIIRAYTADSDYADYPPYVTAAREAKQDWLRAELEGAETDILDLESFRNWRRYSDPANPVGFEERYEEEMLFSSIVQVRLREELAEARTEARRARREAKEIAEEAVSAASRANSRASSAIELAQKSKQDAEEAQIAAVAGLVTWMFSSLGHDQR